MDKSQINRQNTKNFNHFIKSKAPEVTESILKTVTQELIRNTLQCI